MILILGNSEDSILYIKTLIKNEEVFPLTKDISTYVGKIYGQDVCIAYTSYSSYASATISSILIAKYNPYVVIYLGDAMGLSKNLKVGDIFIADSIIASDLDVTRRDSSFVIHRLPFVNSKSYVVNPYLISTFTNLISTATINSIKVGTLVSANKYVVKSSEVDIKVEDIMAIKNSEVAYDNESAGVATACNLYDVPLIHVATISALADKKDTLLDRTKVILSNSVPIGKSIVSFMADISVDENEYIRKW